MYNIGLVLYKTYERSAAMDLNNLTLGRPLSNKLRMQLRRLNTDERAALVEKLIQEAAEMGVAPTALDQLSIMLDQCFSDPNTCTRVPVAEDTGWQPRETVPA
jgi:hypothetical protein